MADYDENIVSFLNSVGVEPGGEGYDFFATMITDLNGWVNPRKPGTRILIVRDHEGVCGLWFATKYPDAEVVSVGDDPSLTDFSKEVAKTLEIKNVTFHQHAYDGWAAQAQADFDIVVSYRGIECVKTEAPRKPRKRSLAQAKSDEILVAVDAMVMDAVKAIANSLSSSGVGLIAMTNKDIGTGAHVLQSLRSVGLRVDWLQTVSTQRKLQELDETVYCLVVGKAVPEWFPNSSDDLQCLVTAHACWGTPEERSHEFDGDDAILLMSMVRGAGLLYQIRGMTFDGIEVVITVKLLTGHCVRSETSANRSRRQFLFPPSRLIHYYQADQRPQYDGKELTNVEFKVTPKFQRLLDFYGTSEDIPPRSETPAPSA